MAYILIGVSGRHHFKDPGGRKEQTFTSTFTDPFFGEKLTLKINGGN